ncbi:5-oxoprolinase subunit PxpA [Haliscomenobacter hydrossis]|uniref:5-oxoprolinase subunit A n=1 Tax=Haliscomenobacter hydrossis (strain ATCC 27775 / DSM 1100 / LMG 10767 / O) TaxID=760192 RepID=F4KPP8_HALH1|nr:5-oxoprolinase subunit PxpA [Haliscomenobacter hydrossis]AEE50986.1 LamB/YcsF family protein [Haliscomenobacter hydrossis DSM 1100]
MIDLNCDLGEGFPADAALMPLISSANIACGYHAGDRVTMRSTIALALEHRVAIGAHPGFDDKANFGRLPIALSPDQIYQLVLEQLTLIAAIAREEGATLNHVKPHGALYNRAAQTPEWAQAIAKAVHDFDANLILFGLSGSHSIRAAKYLGLSTANEVFADRSYQADGSLTPRHQGGALIQDTQLCIAQVTQMIEQGSVTTTTGQNIPLQADTICLHGDGMHAISFAQAIRHALEAKKIVIQAPRRNKD